VYIKGMPVSLFMLTITTVVLRGLIQNVINEKLKEISC